MSRAYFFFADGRVQADAPPPPDRATWQRGDFPRQPSRLADTLAAENTALTVRTFERSNTDPDLWFESRPRFCDIGETLRRYGRMMSAAMGGDEQ